MVTELFPISWLTLASNLHSPTYSEPVRTDCAESEQVRVHSARTVQNQSQSVRTAWIWDVRTDSAQKLHSVGIEPGSK